MAYPLACQYRPLFDTPIVSHQIERAGKSGFYYYIIPVPNYLKTLTKAGVRPGPSGILSDGKVHRIPTYFFNRVSIESFPKRLRRGGKYGHDVARFSRKNKRDISYAKAYNLPFVTL